MLSQLKMVRQGKIRTLYEMDAERLLVVASNKISAYDHVFAEEIPGKGEVLTNISAHVFRATASVARNHFIALAASCHELVLPNEVLCRAMVVRKAEPIRVECVARGYLAGSAWTEYKKTGTVASIRLPSDLQNGDMLPEPIFTPALKADTGHDTNIAYAELEKSVGKNLAGELKEKTLALYDALHSYGRARNIIILDFKCEFGWIDGTLSVIDELGTPDSCRYWPQYDKQYLRNLLDTLGWNRTAPPPHLPETAINEIAQRYRMAHAMLTEPASF